MYRQRQPALPTPSKVQVPDILWRAVQILSGKEPDSAGATSLVAGDLPALKAMGYLCSLMENEIDYLRPLRILIDELGRLGSIQMWNEPCENLTRSTNETCPR